MALLYALITVAATLVGGVLPLTTRLRQLQPRYGIAFAGGLMVAIALFDLIPETKAPNAAALGLGFFGLYLVEKLVMFHACHEAECETHVMGGAAVIGIAAESLIDGLGIAVSFAISPVLGLLVAAAIFVHELPRGFAATAIMRGAGYSIPATLLVLGIDAAFRPLGVLLASRLPTGWFEPLVGFTAGVFLYVGASDLLPEAHRRFNLKVVFSTLLGASLIPALAALFRT